MIRKWLQAEFMNALSNVRQGLKEEPALKILVTINT